MVASSQNMILLMKLRWELDVRSVLLPDLLNYQRFLDNLILPGDMLRTFLCQFSPSLLFKPRLSYCSPTMQDRAFVHSFFFACSLISFLSRVATPKHPDSMQFMQMTCLSCFKLNETSRHTHTGTRSHSHMHKRTHMDWCHDFSFSVFVSGI